MKKPKLESFLESYWELPGILVLFDATELKTYMNKHGDALIGNEFTWDMVHPDDKPRIEKRWNETVNSLKDFEDEYRVSFPKLNVPLTEKYRWYQVKFVLYNGVDSNNVLWLGYFMDVNDKHDLLDITTMYKRQNSMFMTILQQLPTGVIIAEAPSGKIILANTRVEHVLGHPIYHTDGLSDYNQWSAFHPDGTKYVPMDWPLARSLFKGETVINEVTKILRGDNTLSYVSLSSSPVYDDEHKIVAGIVICELLDEKLKLEEKTIQALSEAKLAQEQSRFKSTFIANVSHDLRTPISSIVGISDLLKMQSMNDENQRLVNMLDDSVRILESLINDILDISKIEAGKITLRNEPFSLKSVLDKVVGLTKTTILSFKKNIQVHVIVKDLPEQVKGDEIRFLQIMNNILNNAAKFTPDGGQIIVHLEATMISLDRVKVVFVCQDDGEGMSPEMVKTLFKPFSQGDTSRTRKYSGTGLGLHIVRNLVTLMHGDVSVQSTLGKGSTFTAQVFLDRSTALNVPHESKSDEKPSLLSETQRGKIKFLLADDNITAATIASKLLKLYGYTDVTIVHDGIEAVREFKEKKYDFVLMDCQMPNMDGYEASRAIREFDQITPILAFTASTTSEELDACYQAGMTDVVLKPFKPANLVSKIDMLFQQKHKPHVSK